MTTDSVLMIIINTNTDTKLLMLVRTDKTNEIQRHCHLFNI
jgi:hypothetical protein